MTVRMRHTSAHTKNRRSHHALKQTNLITDKESGALRLPHRLDESTGMYKGIQIVPKKEIKKELAREKVKATKKLENVHPEGKKEPVHVEKVEKKEAGLTGRFTKGRAKARSGFGGGA